jgi:hypothetical protein
MPVDFRILRGDLKTALANFQMFKPDNLAVEVE